MSMKIDFPGGKRVDAHYRGFTIKTDQPEYSGGEGSAPAPFDLFLASLGTCAGIFVLSFCQQRGIPTDDVYVTLDTEHNREARLISKVKIDIHLPEEFPQKYRKSVIRSAELCAVARHLENAPEIVVETV